MNLYKETGTKRKSIEQMEQLDHARVVPRVVRVVVMRQEQRDIARLDPIGILWESLKVYHANAKVFFLIPLTLMLPLAILALALNYLVLSSLPVPPDQIVLGPARPQLEPFLMLFDPALLQLDPVLVLFVTTAFTFVFQMALSLAQAASLLSMGLHYAGQPIVYKDVLRAAMPRLWMRLAITNTWGSVIALFLDLVATLSVLILTPAKLPFEFPLGEWVAFVARIVGDSRTITFTITPGVSVLEEDYGWAAMRKSMKLQKGTKILAQLFFLVTLLPKFLGVRIGCYLVSEMTKGDFSAWTGAQLVLLTLVYLAWTIIMWQVDFLCSGVQYVSFKAFHNESIGDPLKRN